MANLVKIKEVYLYTGFTDNVVDTYKAIKLLKSIGIKYTNLHYNDSETHETLFVSLNTWTLGQDQHKKECSDFPVLVWDECYDDWSTYRRIAHGFKEIEDSDPVKHPELI